MVQQRVKPSRITPVEGGWLHPGHCRRRWRASSRRANSRCCASSATNAAPMGVAVYTSMRLRARAGVCRSTAQNALCEARRLGLVTRQERRRRGQPSLTNIVRIVSAEWRTWLDRGPKGGGVKKSNTADSGTHEVGWQRGKLLSPARTQSNEKQLPLRGSIHPVDAQQNKDPPRMRNPERVTMVYVRGDDLSRPIGSDKGAHVTGSATELTQAP